MINSSICILFSCLIYLTYAHKMNLNAFSTVASGVGSIKRSLLTKTVIVSNLLSSGLMNYGTNNKITGCKDSFIMFGTGFQTPIKSYKWMESNVIDYFDNAAFRFYHDRSSFDNRLSIPQSAREMVELLNAATSFQSSYPSTVLMGHSRGGAVAVVASAMTQRPCHGLFLLDPVDDDMKSAIKACEENDNSFPIAIISTPYGGSSKYYKTAYESACAPSGRNAEAFYNTFLRKDIRHPLIMLTFPNVGHMQLLDDLDNLAIASACSSSSNEQTTQARKCIQAFLAAWLSDCMCTAGRGNESGPQGPSSRSSQTLSPGGAIDSSTFQSPSPGELGRVPWASTARFLSTVASEYPDLEITCAARGMPVAATATAGSHMIL